MDGQWSPAIHAIPVVSSTAPEHEAAATRAGVAWAARRRIRLSTSSFLGSGGDGGEQGRGEQHEPRQEDECLFGDLYEVGRCAAREHVSGPV